jgi:5-methylcytosine-specific restriction enzyme subunit McrC
MRIPVRNLYLLLSYAWDTLDLTDLVEVGAEEFVEPRDLLAQVLLQGCHHVFRRGIDHGYSDALDETAFLHGRINFGDSIRLLAKRSNRLVVEYEDWSPDTQANRVVKAALKMLIAVDDLPVALRRSLAGVYRTLGAVDDIPLTATAIERVKLHRNNRVYRLLIEVARMIQEGVIPREGGVGLRFRDLLRDEHAFRVLFQRFVFNFLRREQRHYTVSADSFSWVGKNVGKSGVVSLPRMRTDVVLRAGGRTIVLDTKFTPRPLASFRGSTTVRPDHMYQIFAYMANLRLADPASGIEGVLLYPATTPQGFDLRWHVHDMPLRVTSVDLSASWPALKAQLLTLANP